MTMKNRTGCMIIALLLCGTAPALAQTTPSTPQQEPLKTNRGSDILARAQTAKQQCINTCRARYRDCRWQLEVDRLGGHEIDHQLDFGRSGHGQDRRFGTFENADHGGFLRFRPWRSFSFSPELLIVVVSAGPAGP